MKRSTLALALVALLALGLASACGSGSTKRTITVSATATVKAKPNLVNFSFGVSSDGSTAAEALTANSTEMRKVIAAIKQEGVAPRDIQTQQVSVYPKTDSNGNRTGYSASNSVSVNLRAVAKAGRLIERVTAAGANLESGPSFSRENPELTYENALNRAIDKAHAKAASIAEHVGLSLGKPASIEEGSEPNIVYGAPMERTAAKGAPVPIEPGRVEVTATVTVSYSAG
jgi:uncharacterized protein YggE